MPIYMDGREYEDEASLEAAYNPVIPESLKRVYITGARESENYEDRTAETTVTVDMPTRFEQQFGVSPQEFFFDYPRGNYTNNPLAKDLGYNDIKKPTPVDVLEFVNSVENMNDPWKGGVAPTSNELKTMNDAIKPASSGAVPFTSSMMPVGSPEKPTGEFISQPGTPVASQANASPEPSKRGFMDKLLGQTGERYQTWPEKAVRDVIAGIELFGGKTPTWAMDPVTGEVRTDTNTIEKVMAAAEMAVMGPAPVAAKLADGTLGSFAGVGAKGFDRNKLAESQIMEANGASVDDVFMKTGMFRGVDGKWRHEINDSKAEFHSYKVSNLEAGDYKRLSDVLEHPELYKAYPELKNIKVAREETPDALARWDSDTATLYLGDRAVGRKDILMHEVQHAIQDLEGFSRGGATAYVKEEGQDVYKLAYQLPESSLSKIREGLNFLISKHRKGERLGDEDLDKLGYFGRLLETHDKYLKAANREAESNYVRLSGEVEARNVQHRIDLSPEQARTISPLMSEDVARHAQIALNTPAWTTAYGALDPNTSKYVKAPSQQAMDLVHFSSPKAAKFRLDQLLRDKAASKKAGVDVESSDYMFYNTQIRELREYLKKN